MVPWSDKHVAKTLRWQSCFSRKFEAASGKWGVSVTFRVCGYRRRLERELPFPKLLPERSLCALPVIVASLIKTPKLLGKLGFTPSTIPPSIFTIVFKAWGGNICPLSQHLSLHSTPSLLRQTEGGTDWRGINKPQKDNRGERSTDIFYLKWATELELRG